MKMRICALVFIAAFFFEAHASADELKLVSEYDGAKLYKAGKFSVLELKGGYRQMGRQYGTLLKSDIARFYDLAVNQTFTKEANITEAEMQAVAKTFFGLYPLRLQEIDLGISEGSGLDINKVMVLNHLEAIVALTKETHCTGIAAWGDYTAGGPLVFGRNFDYPEYFKRFAEFISVVVYKPSDAAIPVAVIGYAGDMDMINGLNKAGLFFEGNDGSRSGGRVFVTNRISMLTMFFSFLLDFSTMEQFDAAIQTVLTDYPMIFNVADKLSARSYECSTAQTRRRRNTEDGYLPATNHFIDESWGIAPPAYDTSLSVERYENLLRIGKEYKARFSPTAMKEILDIPFEKGGVTHPDSTIYQFVFVPETFEFWLKAPGYADWTSIDINRLFKE